MAATASFLPQVNTTLEWAKKFRNAAGPGGDVMFTMGGDFNYQSPNFVFPNIDKLIHYLNLDGRVNAFYSTPATYADAKRAAGLGNNNGSASGGGSVAVKTDDFFPYADGPNAYWTVRAAADTP